MYSIDRDFWWMHWEDDEDGTARLKIEQLGMSYKPRLHRWNGILYSNELQFQYHFELNCSQQFTLIL